MLSISKKTQSAFVDTKFFNPNIVAKKLTAVRIRASGSCMHSRAYKLVVLTRASAGGWTDMNMHMHM